MSGTTEHGPHCETWCTCADDINAFDLRPEDQHRLTTAEESKLLARVNETILNRAKTLGFGAIPVKTPPPTELPKGMKGDGFTADDQWTKSPESDVERQPAYNDRGELVGYRERLPSAWPRPLEPESIEFNRVQVSRPQRVGGVRAEMDDEAWKRMNEAIAEFGKTWKPFIEQLRLGFKSVQESIAKAVAENSEWLDDKPVHPKDVRDERGVKQPSNVVPIWADQPNKRRRRR